MERHQSYQARRKYQTSVVTYRHLATQTEWCHWASPKCQVRWGLRRKPVMLQSFGTSKVICRLLLQTSFFVRGRRQGRQPLNPGAGPAPVSSPEAFGGNRRLYTARCPCRRPPRTYLVFDSGSPAPEPCPVIYSVFCVWCSETIVFYRVLWPSPSPGFTLATLKNHGFFMVLGLRKGSGTENWTSCRPWCQHRANIGQDVGYMGQHKAKIGASLRQHRANIGPRWPQDGPT